MCYKDSVVSPSCLNLLAIVLVLYRLNVLSAFSILIRYELDYIKDYCNNHHIRQSI